MDTSYDILGNDISCVKCYDRVALKLKYSFHVHYWSLVSKISMSSKIGSEIWESGFIEGNSIGLLLNAYVIQYIWLYIVHILNKIIITYDIAVTADRV